MMLLVLATAAPYAHPLLRPVWTLALATFDFDVTGILTYAEDMFNALMPAFQPIIGWQLGIALLLLFIGILGGIFLKFKSSR